MAREQGEVIEDYKERCDGSGRRKEVIQAKAPEMKSQ